MREVIVRPDAEADIEDCADHTIGEWGHEQARKYVRELRRAIESLATGAVRYPLYDEIHPGLRRKRRSGTSGHKQHWKTETEWAHGNSPRLRCALSCLI